MCGAVHPWIPLPGRNPPSCSGSGSCLVTATVSPDREKKAKTEKKRNQRWAVISLSHPVLPLPVPGPQDCSVLAQAFPGGWTSPLCQSVPAAGTPLVPDLSLKLHSSLPEQSCSPSHQRLGVAWPAYSLATPMLNVHCQAPQAKVILGAGLGAAWSDQPAGTGSGRRVLGPPGAEKREMLNGQG